MQIKTTVRYHFTLVRMEWLLSKSLQAVNPGEDVEKKEPSYTVGGMQTSIATTENSVEIP